MSGKISNKKIQDVLSNHGIICFPTETVMGFGIVYDDYESFVKLNSVKGRPDNKPYTLMLEKCESIKDFAYLNEKIEKVINAFLPGPLTLILKMKPNLPNWIDFGTGKIGIRVPSHSISKEVLCAAGKPPLSRWMEVESIFGKEIDYLVKEDSLGDLPSTIVDLSGEEVGIIRIGSISENQILDVIGGRKL